MQFTGEEYYRAAIERMRQAREIHDSGENYALAMYCGGLAVECILRAYRWRRIHRSKGGMTWTRLFRASGLLQIQEERARTKRKPEKQIARSAADILDAMKVVAPLA